MVYCTKCGTQFEGRYCPSCGTLGGAAESAASPAGTPLQAPLAAGIQSNWASVLCYAVPVAGPLIFLFLAPYNRDLRVRFNAWQALFLQLAWMAAHVVANVFNGISWSLANIVHQIIGWVFFATVVVMAVKSYQGEKLLLPVVGPLAEKQK